MVTANSMIQLDNITKFFGPVCAVDRVSFEVEQGEIVGFLGPNGAGKTTTLRILTSYLPATSGIAKVYNYDVMTESMEVRRNIGYLPESVPLYGEMRVEEYLTYRAKIKGVDRKTRPKRLDYVLDRCRVREVRRRLVGTLSKGYRQRVGLADSLIHDPPILIMDEPTAGLDPIQIRQTLRLIQELSESHTILLSTHILSEVEAICQRVIIINSGRVSYSSSLADLEAQKELILEARGSVDSIRDSLRKLPAVTEVVVSEMDNEFHLFEIQVEDDEDHREDIFKLIAGKGHTIRRFDQKRRRLEEAFFEVIRAQDPLKDAEQSTAIQEMDSSRSAEGIQDKSKTGLMDEDEDEEETRASEEEEMEDQIDDENEDEEEEDEDQEDEDEDEDDEDEADEEKSKLK